MKDSFIKASNLGMEYKSDKILSNIDVQIKYGEFVFLIGKSGSGKTAFIELIQGRRMYNSGNLEINNKELSQFNYKELQALRGKMGIVFQETRMIEEWTVFENISYKLEYLGYQRFLIHQRVEEVTTELGISKYLNDYPRNLSGGERQRVNIARALITNPQIIIADEPTSNLDNANSKIVFELLKKMNRCGTTIIMATHNPKFIEESNFRVLKLDGGEKIYDKYESNYFI